jgi:two-component system, sensor histidine kinase and response regulator
VIETLTGGFEPAPAEPGPAPGPEAAVDWDAALEYVGGDRRLLGEMIDLFLEECPRWLAELREAVRADQAADVKRTAHNLKGSMAHFGARAAFEAARALEMMGRSGMLGDAPAACAAFERELERVQPALAAFARAPDAGAPVGES